MRVRIPLLLLGPIAAIACGSNSLGPPSGPNSGGVIEIAAGSASQFTYFSLSSGTPVTVTNPATSSDWDIAVRLYEVRLNGGVAGPKGLVGYNFANNAGANPQEVLLFTPDNQRLAFDLIQVKNIPAAGSFIADGLIANPLGWLAFGLQGPVADSLGWKLRRTAGGGFALFRATQFTMTSSDPQTSQLATVTIEWRYQPAGSQLGAKQTATLTVASGTPALDLSTGSAVAASGCGWDLQANPDFSLSTNAACSVGTFPLDPSESFDALTRADDAPQYGSFLAGVSGAVPFTSALNDPRGPFLYNLAGDNRLSATFNVYLVKAGTTVYKLQFIGYYSATGVSGHPTLRYLQLQ